MGRRRGAAPGHVVTQLHTYDDVRLALAHEFQTLTSLRHPHIISVLDYGFDASGQPFFTMDYLPGTQTIVACGREQSLERQVELLNQTFQALAYLGRRDIGTKWGVAHSLLHLGVLADEQGEHAAARDDIEQSLAIFHEMEDREGVVQARIHLGYALLNLGETRLAWQSLRQALQIAHGSGLIPLLLQALVVGHPTRRLTCKPRGLSRCAGSWKRPWGRSI